MTASPLSTPDATLPAQGAVRVALLGKARSWNNWFSELALGFSELGVRCHMINIMAQSPAERWRQQGRHLSNVRVADRVARQVAEISPDLVVVLNYAGLPTHAAKALRASTRPSTPIVGWLSDRIDALPDDQEPALSGAYYFDSSCQAALRTAYAGQSALISYLPLACCPQRFPYLPTSRPRKPALVFAGHATARRREVFERYQRLGGRLELYGPKCGTWLRPWRGLFLSAPQMARLFRSHIASLNLLQSENTQQGLNLRAFEIPLCGGVGTYPDVPDLRTCFEPGVEILVYRSLEELKEIVEDLAAHPDKAEAIAAAGRARVLREHTWRHRALRLLQDWLPHAVLTSL